MKSHEQQIEEFGKNDDFWLFGYGYVPCAVFMTKCTTDEMLGA